MNFDPISFAMGMNAAKGSGGGSGGGSVEGVHFVTFKSEDGSTELYKRPVANEDDCADPVKRGYIEEPEKESTPQYAYTHAGWSATANGALDSNILKAVTADKTVYTNFAAVLRYYTVTYYDEDGTTVLKTESLAYGSNPSYKPTKDNYEFKGWIPAVSTVTGDISYTASWELKPTFKNASWEKINEICEEGKASETFALGDSKTITMTYADGTSEEWSLRIVGFGQDTKEDGTPAAMTIMSWKISKHKVQPTTNINDTHLDIQESENMAAYMTEIENGLPAEMRAVLKSVKKYDNMFGADTYYKVFIPTGYNLVGSLATGSDVSSITFPYSQYQYFANHTNLEMLLLSIRDVAKTSRDFWVNTVGYRYESNLQIRYGHCYMDEGQFKDVNGFDHTSGNEHGVVACFCI